LSENRLDIREQTKGSKKFNRIMSSWNFWELASFIEYKAALDGVLVIYVESKETSKNHNSLMKRCHASIMKVMDAV